MTAQAPFIKNSDTIKPGPLWAAPSPPGGEDFDPPLWMLDSSAIETEIARRNLDLARANGIPDDLYFFVHELADQLIDLPEDAELRVDPYLLVSAQRALLGALRALDSDDPDLGRRQLRVRLEQLRQVYRDIAEGQIVYEERPPEQLAVWLAEVLDVSQARLAELCGVSPRTFQRWISAADPAGPEGDDARRLRVIARATNHLRHVLTGPGVVRWFEQPHPQLDGLRPLDLLGEADAAVRLATLAADARSHSAA